MGDSGSFATGFVIAGVLICTGALLAGLLLRLPDTET
jgi:UDP-N-acetylmuramyl pentapeptide phosphotransferase/UDP-N-acetylglucosamine-1-phosphate transferase